LRRSKTTHLKLHEEELRTVATLMGCMTGKNIVVAKDLGRRRLSLSARTVTGEEAYRLFLAALEHNDYTYTVSKHGESVLIGGEPPDVDQEVSERARKPGFSPRCRNDEAAEATSLEIKSGVRRLSANAYEIDREMLAEQLRDLGALSRQARVFPHRRGGRVQGFKIVGICPGSLYSYIGLWSGDVIKHIDGQAITDPDKARTLYEKLESQSRFSVELERRGRTVIKEYRFK